MRKRKLKTPEWLIVSTCSMCGNPIFALSGNLKSVPAVERTCPCNPLAIQMVANGERFHMHSN